MELEVQEICRAEFLAGVLQHKMNKSWRAKPTQAAVFKTILRSSRVDSPYEACQQNLDVNQTPSHYSLKAHVTLWIGLFIFIWLAVMIGDVAWEDEPARLYELRLLSEGMLHDLWDSVVSFNTE